MPFLPLLALLFIGLKLGGILAWAWLWVLAPLWIPFAVLLVLGLLGLVGISVGAGIAGFNRKPSKRR